MHRCVWYFWTYLFGSSLNGWHALFCITNNRHNVTITTHAIKRHFLIWMTTMRQPTKRRCSCVLTLIYTLICVYWWTRQSIHNTLIVVDRYLRLMGDTRRSLVWNRFIPHSSQVSIYRIKEWWIPIILHSLRHRQSLPWLLMTWQCMRSRHQQPKYWPSYPGIFQC